MSRKVRFSDPTGYIIRVDGILDESLQEIIENYLVDKAVLTTHSKVSSINGLVKDQAALSGLLNELYYHHCILLSVQQVEEMIG